METLSWVNTRHINERERLGDAKISLSIFAKLIALRRLHIHHRSSSYLYGFQDHLHEHLNTEIELASMTSEDDADPAFPMHRVEEIWPLKYDKLKGINLPLGSVTKPFEGRDAKVSARFRKSRNTL
jgi:hypothetical protein